MYASIRSSSYAPRAFDAGFFEWCDERKIVNLDGGVDLRQLGQETESRARWRRVRQGE